MFIYLLNGLVRGGHAVNILPMIYDGRIREASSRLKAVMDARRTGLQAVGATADDGALCGDLLLAQERDEEAEEAYRWAVRAAADCARGQVRLLACRNTGFLNLFQRRLGTAIMSFRRVADDPQANLAQRVEALAGLAVGLQARGDAVQSWAALAEAANLIPANTHSELESYLQWLRLEQAAHSDVRSHPALQDHAFFQHDLRKSAFGQIAAPGQDAGLKGMLFSHRFGFLQALVKALHGDKQAMHSLHEHHQVLRRAGLPGLERRSRIDAALVAIVHRQGDLAHNLLENQWAGDADAPHKRSELELSYCQAKVCELAGRTTESLRHYQRYTHESVRCLRSEAVNIASAAPYEDSGTSKDDVEMSLPAKYRRAYRYLIAHLDCAELSVREISEHIGVTERALQATFRTHIGMTPAEVLRRARVERIRNDLLSNETRSGSIFDTAARWGIHNRSTLVSCYRRYFQETPAQTLMQGRSARHGQACSA